DVAFQGFNTWHSLQYLALTWFILSRNAAHGDMGGRVTRQLAGAGKTGRFYGAMVGATLVSGGLYLVLWRGLGFPQDKSYYVVARSPDGSVISQRSHGWRPCVASSIRWIAPPNRLA